MTGKLRSEVRRRANGRCEYCGLPDAYDEWPFHVDHIVARQHGGKRVLSNLSWTCSRCNLNKGPNIAGVDPATGATVALYHPRTHRWAEHFAWSGARAVGLTPAGRATVATLRMNAPILLAKRRQLIAEGVYGH